MLRPKVVGTWNLYELLQDRPDAVFISFAPLTGYFGGSTVGAFAAASRFQEHFSHYLDRRVRLRSYCYSWGLWEGTGISQGSPLLGPMRARGYHALTGRQGLASFLAGLQQRQPQLMLGLDGTNAHIRREVEGACYAL